MNFRLRQVNLKIKIELVPEESLMYNQCVDQSNPMKKIKTIRI